MEKFSWWTFFYGAGIALWLGSWVAIANPMILLWTSYPFMFISLFYMPKGITFK